MNMSVMEEKKSNKMYLGTDGNALVNLVVVNAVCFLLLQFVYVIYVMSELDLNAYTKNVFHWFALPGDLEKLGTRPWTVITHMFADRSILGVLANTLWLWVFGYIMQEHTGNRKLVPLFLYGGFVGAVLYVLTAQFFPTLLRDINAGWYWGANASVMAVAVAATFVQPDYRIFPLINGGIPLWIVALLFVIIDFATIPYGDPAKYVSHAGGALVGYLFIYQLKRGNDWSNWLNSFFDWVENLFNPDKKKKERSFKDEFFYKVKGSEPFKKTPNVTQQRIDLILDKINKQGYHLLTDEEKDILRRASKEGDL